MRRSATNTNRTATAESPRARFLASPRLSSAAGPADATSVRMPAAHRNELSTLIGLKISLVARAEVRERPHDHPYAINPAKAGSH